MDIKDFAKQNQQKQKEKEFDEKKMQEDYGDLVQEFLKRYGKMDDKQMLYELFLLVKQKKEQGTFDIGQIEKATTAIEPFLNSEQKSYMHELLNKLR